MIYAYWVGNIPEMYSWTRLQIVLKPFIFRLAQPWGITLQK
jgi:hypothetical protein